MVRSWGSSGNIVLVDKTLTVDRRLKVLLGFPVWSARGHTICLGRNWWKSARCKSARCKSAQVGMYLYMRGEEPDFSEGIGNDDVVLKGHVNWDRNGNGVRMIMKSM